MKKILFIVAIFSFLFFSCKKKQTVKPGINDEFGNEFVEEVSDETLPFWQPSQKKICVIFGYGYNEKSYVEKIVSCLEKKYGIDAGDANSGLIFPLIFPDDFPYNKISRISSLIGERELAGLIVVGAPENTNSAIANLEDEWDSHEKMIPYPVYAFFPQDDVAGIEATANFVVDRALEGSGNADSSETNKEEVTQTQIADLGGLLDRAIEYMLLTGEPLPPNSDLFIHVSRIVGEDYKLSRYVDAESGLQSINHFVIEDLKK